MIQTDKGKTIYLNSGDWVENLTALEYNNKKWKLYKYVELESASYEDEIDFEYENKLAEQFISALKI